MGRQYMSRDSKVYLEDIIGAVCRIRKYLEGRPWKEASKDEKTFDAVVRNIEVIGEGQSVPVLRLSYMLSRVPWSRTFQGNVRRRSNTCRSK
jgi:uncharacterized protein with HEPN domain